MSITELIKQPESEFDEIAERLGSIAPDRIAAFPTPGTATEEDLLLPRDDGRDHILELVDGVLVEKPMSTYESILAGLLIQRLNNHLDQEPLGVVVAPDGLLRLKPGLVRAPDVSFISWDRFPEEELPDEAIYRTAPDLAVEIISEGNTREEMERKLQEYFSAGSRLAWLVYPKTRSVHVYTTPDDCTVLSGDDILDGGSVIPGFNLSIREWFQRAQRPQRPNRRPQTPQTNGSAREEKDP